MTIAGGKSGITPRTLKGPIGEDVTVVTAFKPGFRSSIHASNWAITMARTGKQLKSTGQNITGLHHFTLRRALAQKDVKIIKDGITDLDDFDARGNFAAGTLLGENRFNPISQILRRNDFELTGGGGREQRNHLRAKEGRAIHKVDCG